MTLPAYSRDVTATKDRLGFVGLRLEPCRPHWSPSPADTLRLPPGCGNLLEHFCRMERPVRVPCSLPDTGAHYLSSSSTQAVGGGSMGWGAPGNEREGQVGGAAAPAARMRPSTQAGTGPSLTSSSASACSRPVT